MKINVSISRRGLKSFLGEINENKTIAISFLTVFISLISGVIYFLFTEENEKKILENHFLQYIDSLVNSDKLDILLSLLKHNLCFIFIIFILGTSLIGYVLIIVVSYLKCLGITFLNCLVLSLYGLKGFEYICMLQLPGKLIFLFSLLLIMRIGIDSSLKIKKTVFTSDKNSLFMGNYLIQNLTVSTFFILSILVDFICISLFLPIFDFG